MGVEQIHMVQEVICREPEVEKCNSVGRIIHFSDPDSRASKVKRVCQRHER